MKKSLVTLLVAALAVSLFSCKEKVLQFDSLRPRIELAGRWQSSLGECQLPGTTDENRLGGGEHPTDVTHQLTRRFPYSGKVTYSRTIDIPEEMSGRRLILYIERTKPSTLWIDGDSIGSYGHLYAPHSYELPLLSAGQHEITICVDNSYESVPKEIHGSHAWTDATQTNWNGILGDFYIEATPNSYIQQLHIYPQVTEKQSLVRLYVHAEAACEATFSIEGEPWNCLPDQVSSNRLEMTATYSLEAGDNEVEMTLLMGDNPLLWSEFHPSLYKVNVCMETPSGVDNRVASFGMRDFRVQGTQFVINGNKTFLRGKHDACVFPLTGYAPTDVNEWRRMFQIAKDYGINHFRCHSYTPTRAAFEAADIEGIYFHAELPLWGGILPENKALNAFLLREGEMILDCFANHPSFMMLGLGNELYGDIDLMRQFLDRFRELDDSRLYSFGANNNLGWMGPRDGEDFFITCRIGGGEGYSTHVRSSFSFADADEGGILNNTRPATDRNYSGAIASCPRPVISHESCQFQIYPDYAEIDKYRGVLYPYNLEIFRDRLQENSLSDQAKAFHDATGRFAVECYKADMEYCFRTPGFGGFQLLDLQDFPGQGSALVGILDAFMDSKGIVAPETFRGFCAPVVPLALMSDHCWSNDQPFSAAIQLSNFEEQDWNNDLVWQIEAESGELLWEDRVTCHIPQGEVGEVTTIHLPLSEVDAPCRLRLHLHTGGYHNSYNFWVYPVEEEENEEGLLITNKMDAAMHDYLMNGGAVLLTPDHRTIEAQSVGGLFTPDYWNYAMFKSISENNGRPVSPGTLSILTDPAHPLFTHFPTEHHSNWQWWSIARFARPMILNSTRDAYKPLVQVVDNVERNHKLGLLFEFAVGKGRLLVCMADMERIAYYPEGRQFKQALLRYMKSDQFSPSERLSWKELNELFTADVKVRNVVGVENISDYTIQE
ncbi:glycoside hydrolase [Parabacteroides sp. OttesenSCG-928-N08]|nr:glycoside hydrolase [Parabacteroides sp. OttesenSCG-928-N08]